MTIREYRETDSRKLAELFCETIHSVNAKDYTKEQREAWASGCENLEKWDRSFREHETVVAVEGERIAGFGDMERSGYLDRLFVHRDYQGQGIATAICDRLEATITTGKIRTQASITAKPFFERRGYKTVKEQQVCRKGIWLKNYIMEKEMPLTES